MSEQICSAHLLVKTAISSPQHINELKSKPEEILKKLEQ
jgi:hypothetical protein